MERVKSIRKSPGPSPLTAARQEYARLTARGVSNAEACRLVGVNRRTGTRWRYGRSVPTRDGRQLHYRAMVDTTVVERSERFLSEEERMLIADRRRTKVSNQDPAGRYRPSAAHRMATVRLARPRARKVDDPVLAGLVQAGLDLKWSPEQISHSLAIRFPKDPIRQVATESIYQALYVNASVLQRDPATCLRSGRRRRRPHRRADRRRHRETGQMASIADRSVEADDRSVPGHWEGDRATRSRTNMSGLPGWRGG